MDGTTSLHPIHTKPNRSFAVNRRVADLRVAFISDAILGRNGVGTYYQDLIEQLEDHFGVVDLICPGASGYDSLHAFSCAMPGDPTQRLYFPKRKRVAHALRAASPDVIVAATPGPYGFHGLRQAKALGVPVCVGFHTEFELLADMYWNRVLAKVFGKSMDWCNSFFFKRAALVVAKSGQMAQKARKAGAFDVRIVGSPIARQFIAQPPKPLRPQIDTIVFAGRLAPEKNLKAVVEAAANLPEIEFRIAGDGPLRTYVEKAAQKYDNVEYLGWVSRGDLVQILDSADMLVLPSFVESFGTIALEAMARERIVLASHNCGLFKWQHFAQCVFQMNPNEPLHRAIQEVQRLSSEQRQQKAEAAYALATMLNSKVVDEWVDLLTMVSSRKCC